MKETTVLTNTETEKIYNALSAIDAKSINDLKNAEQETENANYDSITEIETDYVMPDINVTNKDYKDTLKDYNINEQEMYNMIDLINNYKSNIDMNYYERLPKSFKDIADAMNKFKDPSTGGKLTSKNSVAKELINELIHDTEFSATIDAFQSELSNVTIELNSEYDKMLNDAFNESFEKIEELKTTNQEQAEKILRIKKAFEESNSFDKQIEFLQKYSAKRLTKMLTHYDNEVKFFNKYINVTEVKVPDVGELLPVIKRNLPEYSENDIKLFIIAICKTCYSLDFANNIAHMAYIYKLINSIYMHKFIKTTNSEEEFLLFKKIAEAIDSIQQK